MRCLTQLLVSEGAPRIFLARNWSRQMSISTRQRSWHRRFINVVKKALRNKHVFRWTLFGLRIVAEVRKWITEVT